MSLQELYKLFLKHPIVSTDTRNLPQGCIFFALKGPNFNANSFAAEAINKGAAFSIIDDLNFCDPKNPNIVWVPDVLSTLQNLAAHHRKQLPVKVLGIGGSNGKTTTKELCFAVLSTHFNTFATPGNLNNHIGVPLSLLQLTPKHQWAVIELGSNHPGEMEPLLEMAHPEFGIVTNIGKDHLEGYGSLEGAARENSTVYFYLEKNGGTALVNTQDEHLVRMAKRLSRKVLFGAPEQIQIQETNSDFLTALTQSQNTIHTQLIGEYNLPNIAAALTIGQIAGIPETDAIKALENYQPGNNRSQLMVTENNQVIADCYNANPSSMELSIKSHLKTGTHNKVLILGEMREMGIHAPVEHQGILNLLSAYTKAEAYLVGQEFSNFKTQYPQFNYYNTREELANYIANHPIKGKKVLLKASRGIALEKLIPLL